MPRTLKAFWKPYKPEYVAKRHIRNAPYRLRKQARQEVKAERQAARTRLRELQLSLIRTGRIGSIDKTTFYENKDYQHA